MKETAILLTLAAMAGCVAYTPDMDVTRGPKTGSAVALAEQVKRGEITVDDMIFILKGRRDVALLRGLRR